MSPEAAPPVESQRPEPNHSMRDRLGALAMTALIAPGAFIAGFEAGGADTPHGSEIPAAVRVVDTTKTIDSTTHISVDGSEQNKYQEAFQTDTEDGRQTLEQVVAFVTAHKAELQSPASIDRVIITGLASAEDEQQTDASLQQPSELNIQLAGQRGQLAARALVQEVSSQLGVDISDKVQLGASEDSLSDTELSHVQSMAEQFGYSSTRAMIDQYNQLGDVPPEVAEFLDQVLAGRRGATIEIQSHETVHKVVQNREQKRHPKQQEIRSQTAIERYDAYIPEQVAPITPGTYYEEARNRDRGQDKARAGQDYGHVIGHIKDPRRSNFSTPGNVRHQNGRKGARTMNQTRRGRG